MDFVRKTIKILVAFIPLIIGGIIYIIYRTENLKMFNWFKKIGILNIIRSIRNSEVIKNIKIKDWIIYSLPDALWLLSLNFTILIFWKYKITKHSIIWIIIIIIVGIYSEIGQYINKIPGTFDKRDLILLITAIIIPFLFIKNINSKNNKKYERN
jgi:hypothetical protein